MTVDTSMHPGRRRRHQTVVWAVRLPGAGRLDHQRPQGGQLAACEIDLDLLLNGALARIPPDSSIRVEVWRA